MAVANTISNIFCGIIKDKMTNIIEEDELIPNEFYKEGGEKIEEGLLDLFESIDEGEEVPIEWLLNMGRKKKKDIKKTTDQWQ